MHVIDGNILKSQCDDILISMVSYSCIVMVMDLTPLQQKAPKKKRRVLSVRQTSITMC